MAASEFARAIGYPIVLLTGLATTALSLPRSAGLELPFRHADRRVRVKLPGAVSAALVSGRQVLLSLWWVAALAFWLLIAGATIASAIAAI
jgi:hypothetical protein